MPYQFKNNSPLPLPKGIKIVFYFGVIFGYTVPFIDILFGKIAPHTFIEPILATFLLWGVRCNGFYKISRYIAERRVRRFDNKWRS